jgi:hypothetical protein
VGVAPERAKATGCHAAESSIRASDASDGAIARVSQVMKKIAVIHITSLWVRPRAARRAVSSQEKMPSRLLRRAIATRARVSLVLRSRLSERSQSPSRVERASSIELRALPAHDRIAE